MCIFNRKQPDAWVRLLEELSDSNSRIIYHLWPWLILPTDMLKMPWPFMIQPRWKKSSNNVQGKANPSTHGLFIINGLHFVRKRKSDGLKCFRRSSQTLGNVF